LWDTKVFKQNSPLARCSPYYQGKVLLFEQPWPWTKYGEISPLYGRYSERILILVWGNSTTAELGPSGV